MTKYQKINKITIMNILLSWLNEFIKINNTDVNVISKTLTEIGLEVEDVE